MVVGAFWGFELPPLAGFAIALLVILVVRSWPRSPANIPPFPTRPWPILGHLTHLSKKPRDVVMEWRKSTGEIFSLYLGPQLAVVFSSYDLMKETIVKQADLFSERPIGGFFPVLGKAYGVIQTSGELWKENRTTVLSILRGFGMGKNVMAEKIEEEVHAYLEEVEQVNGKPHDFRDLNFRAVSNVVCSMILGKRFEYSDAYYKKFLKIFEDAIQLGAAGHLHACFPWVKYIPGDLFSTKLILKNKAVIDAFMRDMMRKTDDEEADGINKNNVIAHYLREMREKREKGIPTLLSEDSLSWVIMDLMLAGTETTATTLLWFNIYMIRSPEVQKKIHEEIDEVIGHGREPMITDRAKMVYMNAAIMETQRLASIIPLGITHRAPEETTVRGYTIPKDTLIIVHQDAALLSEDIWGDPHNFRPERFIDAKGNLMNREELIPFSLGRRVCLGEAIAKAELFIFLTHIYQRYTAAPEVPNTKPSLNYVFGATCSPIPHKIRLIKRDV